MARQPKTIATPRAKSIRDFYKLGLDFLEATGGVRSSGAAKAFAREHHYSEVTVYKARQFSEMYDQDELEELCKLGEKDGTPLGIGHVHQLIQVKSKTDRDRLQAAAAKNGWSSRKLKEMRKQKFGYDVATKVGRKPRRAEDIDEALLQLAQRSDQWKRWGDALSPLENDQNVDFDLGELSDAVRNKLDAVTIVTGELAETLQRVMRKRNSQKSLPKKKR